MAGSFVRVDPPFVEFKNARGGGVYETFLKVTNVGKNMKKITFTKPTLEVFELDPPCGVVSLASGLSVSVCLKFSPESEEEVRDCLQVHVNDKESISIPLLVSSGVCLLSMDPSIDFGCVAASSEVIIKHHPITNHGSVPGMFRVQSESREPQLSLSPHRGVVAAGATKWLKVELYTDRPGRISEQIPVELQDGAAVVLSIRADVVEQRLEVVDFQGTLLPCVEFGCVYFGTSCVKKAVLRNSGPAPCDWVSLLQETAAGTELGADLQRSTCAALLDKMKKCSLEKEEVSQNLVCVPAEGRLGPKDQTTVSLYFSPICSRHADRQQFDLSPCRRDYCLFLLFDSVESRHGFTHRAARSSVEIAVTGSGLPVRLLPSPSHRFEFPSCAPGQRADVPCVLQNLCHHLPVTFRFRKMAQFCAEPAGASIGPGQRLDGVLSFKPRQHGRFCVQQKLDVLGRVFKRNEDQNVDLELCSFHTITLHLTASCKTQSPVLPLHDLQTGQLSRRQTENDNSPASIIRETSRSPAGPGVPQCVPVDVLTERRQHGRMYVNFLRRLRQTRLHALQEREQKNMEDSVDIGIVPCHGLVPPKLPVRVPEEEFSDPELEAGSRFLLNTDSTQLSEETNAVPSSDQQEDCSRTLTPRERYQVIVEPRFLDFGRVCVDSECARTVKLINLLPVHVWLQLEVGCPEPQCSAPFSHVLPPRSHRDISVMLQSGALGPVCRSLSYSVNQRHAGQIVVQAQVTPLSLELSTAQLLLHPNPHRSAVTLRNPCTRAAGFTWRPVLTQSDAPFSVRPATGTVRPLGELDCEVEWHPSFCCSSEGDFELFVHEGNVQQLHCIAKVGSTSVQPAQDRVVFGSVPLNMPSVRTAVLHNSGQNQAFYQVVEESLPAGMAVRPREGVLPSRAQTVLQIHYSPEQICGLDGRVEISLRNMKRVQLRVVGTVEPPDIHMSVTHFQFHGVYVGSQQRIPFSLTNRSPAAATVAFHLSDHPDFFIQSSGGAAGTRPSPGSPPADAGLDLVEIPARQTENCFLLFSPSQVASHEFHLHLRVNGGEWPPSSSVRPLSPSDRLEAAPLIRASALFPPLEVSPRGLEFHLDPHSHLNRQEVELTAASRDAACWSLLGGEVRWWFDCREAAGLLLASPSCGSLEPDRSIQVVVTVNPEVLTAGTAGTRMFLPLYVGKQQDAEGRPPYRRLSVTVTSDPPTISLQPRRVLLSPAPLRSSVETTLALRLHGYPGGTEVSAEVHEVELEDGTKIQPFTVVFPEGNAVPACSHKQEVRAASLTCRLTFSSDVPVCLRSNITFSDHMTNRFSFEVCAAADNSLLTLWSHMALRHGNQRVVLKIDEPSVTADLQSCGSPSPASGPTSSSSPYDHSSSETQSPGRFFVFTLEGSMGSVSSDTLAPPSRVSSVPLFAAADTEEGPFHRSVRVAAERWFSLFGWPSGPHPLSVPHTLRRVVSDAHSSGGGGRTHRIDQNKDTRSFLDMLHHLSGRQIPGVPVCRSVSEVLERRVQQLLLQHEAALSFLTAQGACLAHIQPQYLLDVQEFEHWCLLQAGPEEDRLDRSSYESVSKRSWTDVLLQVYKVLVLRRVSVRCLPSPLDDSEGADVLFSSSPSVESNFYSSQELLLLSWLNQHYHRMRGAPWAAGGAAPTPARWIVNFDLDLEDGLVLASVLASHCPALIRGFLSRMYAAPSSLEEVFHNNLIVVQVLTRLNLSMNVKPTDLCDPNPVQMLMLCVHLYEALPQFAPKDTITLCGHLHGSFSKQVRLSNPSSKTIRYRASLYGEDAHWFSFPAGSKVIIPPRSSAELSVQFRCFCLRQMQAVLVLTCGSASDVCSLAFSLRTRVSHISPTSALTRESPCYQLCRIQLPLTSSFPTEALFRVVLVESSFNPLESESGIESIVHQAAGPADRTEEEMQGTVKEGGGERHFLSQSRSVLLKANQKDSLNLLYLPFVPGIKHLCVLLLNPQVGDMVHLVKATAHLPLPCPLSVRTRPPSAPRTPVLSLHCQLGDVLEEVLQIPRINVPWEQALAEWAQHCMSVDELRRRRLTRSLKSSTVRANMATQKLCRQPLWGQREQMKQVEYRVEVSLPQNFTLPSPVTVAVKEDADAAWDDSAECVDVPLQFRADSVGQFPCQVVLESWMDTRLYLLEVLVTAQGGSAGSERVVAFGGVEVPRDRVLLHCPVGRSSQTQLDVPNSSKTPVTLKVVTDLSIVSGIPKLEVKPGHVAPYTLTVSPWRRGRLSGSLSFLEVCDGFKEKNGAGTSSYEVHFSLEIMCEPAAPLKVIRVRCVAETSAVVDIPVCNGAGEPLVLDVMLEGDHLTGEGRLSVPARETLSYKVTFRPVRAGRSTGSVVFQSEQMKEFWYQLELCGLPPAAPNA